MSALSIHYSIIYNSQDTETSDRRERRWGNGLKSRQMESWIGKQMIPGSLPEEKLFVYP